MDQNPPNDQNNAENTSSPKQQVVERVKAATNVLVTVSSDPTVDELAACIGLTVMLNKLGKHATAVFSGKVPSTLEFLQPEKTLETNTDSLRDFIVSLDKAKADKLRYKVEENVVKIFITPYRTSLSEKDLEFTQGDFNVDVVLALGVSVREELDQAIVAHGRILHDATVVTICAGQQESTLGAINWQEPGASSLSEMLVSVSEAFQGNLIDDQMATAFLTGIVAETDRFRNNKTTPKVMTMSAQLMAAGANQQLIANELEKDEPVPEPAAPAEPAPAAEKPEEPKEPEPKEEPAPEPVLPPMPDFEPTPEPEPEAPEIDETEIHIDNNGVLRKMSDVDASKETAPAAESALASNTKRQHTVIQPLNQEPKAAPTTDLKNFNFAGQQQPAAPAVPPFTSNMPEAQPEQSVNPLVPPSDSPLMPGQAPPTTEDNISGLSLPPIGGDTLLDIEKSVHSPHIDDAPAGHVDSARDAVQSVLDSTPYDAAHPQALQSLNAQPMFDTTPPEPAQSTQDVFPLGPPSEVFASHDTGTPQFPLPDQPTPQEPGGMPLHSLGETIPEPQTQDDGPPPPPVPPPLNLAA
jgi:hypothetical protein